MENAALELARESLETSLVLLLPLLGIVLVFGMVIGLLQTVTQVHDSSLATAPKIVVLFIVLILLLPWLTDRIVDYAKTTYTQIPQSFERH